MTGSTPIGAARRLVGPALLGCLGALLVALSLVSAVSADPRIAFVRENLAGNHYSHVWTIAPDGTGLKRLTAAAANDLAPAWSSQRGTIAFIRSRSGDVYDRRARLMLMRSDGTNQRQLVHEGPSLTSGSKALAYSPNGRLLAGGTSLRTKNGYGHVWAVTVLDLKSRESRIIYRYPSQNGVQSLTWSPNGKQLVATVEYGGGYGMFRIDVGRKRLLKEYDGGQESASWRPDGKYLLCAKWFPSEAGAPFRTLLIRPGGAVVATLGEAQRHPVYSPDGSRYAFVGPANTLARANANGANVTNILVGRQNMGISSPTWK